jgi:hypothetical protein
VPISNEELAAVEAIIAQLVIVQDEEPGTL